MAYGSYIWIQLFNLGKIKETYTILYQIVSIIFQVVCTLDPDIPEECHSDLDHSSNGRNISNGESFCFTFGSSSSLRVDARTSSGT